MPVIEQLLKNRNELKKLLQQTQIEVNLNKGIASSVVDAGTNASVNGIETLQEKRLP